MVRREACGKVQMCCSKRGATTVQVSSLEIWKVSALEGMLCVWIEGFAGAVIGISGSVFGLI